MSSDHDKAADHGDAHGDSHGGHDAHTPATDVIPENSPQDMLLKLVTVVGAILIIGCFGGWWMTTPLPEGGEHGGHAEGAAVETTEH